MAPRGSPHEDSLLRRNKQRQKDEKLFVALAAVNERFGKLQDTLCPAMRHNVGAHN